MGKWMATSILSVAVVSLPAMAGKPVREPPPPAVTGLRVYSAEQPIGYVLSLYRGTYGEYLAIISDSGYLAEFFVNTGAFLTHPYQGVPGIVYTGTNCTGDMYASGVDDSMSWKLRQGWVFSRGTQTYYSIRGAVVPSAVFFYSARNLDGSCYTYPTQGSTQYGVPAFLNDPGVTKVPSEGLALPVAFGIP